MRRCVERKPSHRSISERRISRTLRASALGQFASPDQLSPRLGGRAAQLELPRCERAGKPSATCPSASAQTDSVPGAAQRILGRMPVLLAAAAFLLVGLDGSVNIAFPAMSAAFGVGPTTIRWVIICYVGTYALTAFAAGVLADRLGPGRVVRAGLVLSLLCFAGYALVPSFAVFLAFRVLQGAAGGLLYGASPALVTLSLPPSRHGWGLGWASTGLGIGLSVSPLIGGALVSAFGWKSVFLFRVPIVALFVVLAAWTVTPRAGGHGARMVAPTDILRWPMLHAGLLAFLANFAQFAVWLLAPYYLVTERGLTATAGGLLFMLTPIATALAAPIAGRVTDRWGPRGPMVAGLVAETLA